MEILLNCQTYQALGKPHSSFYNCYFENKFSLNRRPPSALCSRVLMLMLHCILLVVTQDWNSFLGLVRCVYRRRCTQRGTVVGFGRFWTSTVTLIQFVCSELPLVTLIQFVCFTFDSFFCPFFWGNGRFLRNCHFWPDCWEVKLMNDCGDGGGGQIQCTNINHVNKLLYRRLAFLLLQCKVY